MSRVCGKQAFKMLSLMHPTSINHLYASFGDVYMRAKSKFALPVPCAIHADGNVDQCYTCQMNQTGQLRQRCLTCGLQLNTNGASLLCTTIPSLRCLNAQYHSLHGRTHVCQRMGKASLFGRTRHRAFRSTIRIILVSPPSRASNLTFRTILLSFGAGTGSCVCSVSERSLAASLHGIVFVALT